MLGEFTGRSLHDHQRNHPFRLDAGNGDQPGDQREQPEVYRSVQRQTRLDAGAWGRTAPRTGRATFQPCCDADGHESMHRFQRRLGRMVQLKTRPTDADVAGVPAAVLSARRREDAEHLAAIMTELTERSRSRGG